jgi:hypothetical protein
MEQTIQDVKIGETYNHPYKGEGLVIGKTKRTITVKFDKSTTKLTYNHNDAYFCISDF